MVLEDVLAMRFSAVKKSYAVGMHFEVTRGSKNQAEDYIYKRPPFTEKGEEVICAITYGEIQGRQGKRSDLEVIQDMIEAGMTPTAIMRENLSFRRFSRMIREAYFDMRNRETPPFRKVTVHYIVGEAGTGKSYRYVELCNEYGEDNIYFVSDYGTGCFDRYCGEPILMLDEFKEELSYQKLLVLLDGYKSSIQARYANVTALWTEVYITSVYPPEELYNRLVPLFQQHIDTYEQLRRRITDITYCFRSLDDGTFSSYTLPMSYYINYDALIWEATQEPPFLS